jgi:hypothetical protein
MTLATQSQMFSECFPKNVSRTAFTFYNLAAAATWPTSDRVFVSIDYTNTCCALCQWLSCAWPRQHLVRFFRHRDRVLVGSLESDGCNCISLKHFVLYIQMTGLWRTCSCARTILHAGVTKRRCNATANALHGQAELREPRTHTDAKAAPRTVTQNSVPVQRYCIRALSSCKAPARVASLGDEVLDGSTEAKETRYGQPARGTATKRLATVPTARRSAAAVQQEAENSASVTDSRAQDPIERTLRRLVSLHKRGKRIKIAWDRPRSLGLLRSTR